MADANTRNASDPSIFFWDVENIHVPKEFTATEVVNRIIDRFATGSGSISFYAVLDTHRQKAEADELSRTRATVIHVKSGEKNAVDNKIIDLMDEFVPLRKSKCQVILVSNDGDYVEKMITLKEKFQTEFSIVHTKYVSNRLIDAASTAVPLDEILDPGSEEVEEKMKPKDVSVTIKLTSQKDTLKKLVDIANLFGGKIFYLGKFSYLFRFKDCSSAVEAAKEFEKIEDLEAVALLVPMTVQDYEKLTDAGGNETAAVPAKKARADVGGIVGAP